MLLLKCSSCGRTYDTNRDREPGFLCRCGEVVLLGMDDESSEESIELRNSLHRALANYEEEKKWKL